MAGRRARWLGQAAAAIAGGALAVLLVLRLPARVVALRMRIFARVNGDDGIPVPGPLVSAGRFRQVYAHPAADGRSRGAPLSDLFWYWLSPGAEIHQEHLEPGERYDEVARTTRRILTMPTARVEDMAARYTAQVCWDRAPDGGIVRLRDLMMPVWAGFFTEVVFGAPCSRTVWDLVVANADDVVTALKCCGLRHMERRHRLTRYLVEHLGEVDHALPGGLTYREQALYLQGTFFNTAVVQMSEAMAHLLMVLAQHPELQSQVADRTLLDQVMDETMRLYPLFGIAHRITSGDIVVDQHTTLPAGSVLCFNYPEYHRAGYRDAERFDPSRWELLAPREANFVPFGVPGNRPCPAWHLAPIAMRAATQEVLARYALRSSAQHTRSLPNRGPCLLLPREPGDPRPRAVGPTLAWMRARDRVEDVGRSLVQLVLGSYMVWDARRQALCRRHFEAGSLGRSGSI